MDITEEVATAEHKSETPVSQQSCESSPSDYRCTEGERNWRDRRTLFYVSCEDYRELRDADIVHQKHSEEAVTDLSVSDASH